MVAFQEIFRGVAKDPHFVVILLQLICVALSYKRVRQQGPYWDTLLVASISGFIAVTLASIGNVVTRPSVENDNFKELKQSLYILFIVCEPFWAIFEFSVIVCNYIKLACVLAPGSRLLRSLKPALLGTFLAFFACRIYIGCFRYLNKTVNEGRAWNIHTPAYICLFIPEMLVTALIIYTCCKRANHKNEGIFHIKSVLKSNFFILVTLDICGCFLTLASALVGVNSTFSVIVIPLNLAKSTFPLILTLDAVFIKMESRQLTLGPFPDESARAAFSQV
jgi:hypothetical protein